MTSFDQLEELFASWGIKPTKSEAHVLSGLTEHSLRIAQDNTEVLRANQEMVARLMQQQEGAAAAYEASSVTIGPGQPYNVLPMDLSRLLAKITAPVDGIQIGKQPTVSTLSGYPLWAKANFETKTTDALWLVNTTAQAVTIGVYVEKTAI